MAYLYEFQYSDDLMTLQPSNDLCSEYSLKILETTADSDSTTFSDLSSDLL